MGRGRARTSADKILFACLVLFYPLLSLSCAALPVSAPPPRATVRLELVGADSMATLAQSLADAYTPQHPGITLTIRATNSENGLRAAREYSGTIGMVSRAIKPDELDQMRAVVVARDGVAIVVHKNNPINAITRAQIVQVFGGEIPTWPLGPSMGKSIVVVSREDGSGTRDAFETMAMQGMRVTRTAVVMPNEAAVVDFIAHTPEAIGYTSMGALTPDADAHALAVDDVPLSVQTVESKQYPFIRTFAFVVPEPPDPEMQDFIAFALSAEGQRIVGQKFGRLQ